jgi:hypothetical protein
MQGTKNSEYGGGHRVPFFIPIQMELGGGKDVLNYQRTLMYYQHLHRFQD